MGPGWALFTDAGFAFEFRYPLVAPSGAVVDVRRYLVREGERVHVLTADSREVYFELDRVAGRTPDEGFEQLTADVARRFTDAIFGGLEAADLAGKAARQFTFSFSDRVRMAMFSHETSPSHRVIYDPRSEVNLAILGSLRLR